MQLHLRNLQFHGEWPGISSQLQFPSAQEFGQRGGSDETQAAALDWIEVSVEWKWVTTMTIVLINYIYIHSIVLIFNIDIIYYLIL